MNSTGITIYNRATCFFSSPESKCSCDHCTNLVEFKLNIPIIQRVCEFDVQSNIIIEKSVSNTNKFICKFEITSKKIKTKKSNYYKFFTFEKTLLKLSVKNTNKFVMDVKEILPKLNFNKLTGLFELDLKTNLKINNFLDVKTNYILGFDTFDTSYADSGDCCVCYEKTLTKTSCSHFLCVECWTKIKNVSECPYCRNKKIKIKSIDCK